MLSSRAQSTTAGYNRSFQKWKNFATHILQVPYLPADPFHVALYLQHLAETSSIAAINSTFYSINWAHGLAGIPSPTHNIFLVTVREGIIRRFSKGHTSRKQPLDIAHLKTLGTKIDLNDLLQLRSYVMFVISFAGFLRSSEVINLISNDIIFHHNYISISIRQSKTDQLRDGETVVLTELEDSRICPVKLLKRYLDITRIPPGTNEFLFRPISGQGKSRCLKTVNKPISYATYRESFKRLFKDIVSDISRYSTHSMRSGGATLAANAGIPERQLQRHGRWKSTAAKDMYIKDSLRSRLSVSNSLDSAP